MDIKLYIVIFCLLGSAFFSASETAFSTVNKLRLKLLSDEGNNRATLVLKLIEDFDKLISSILVGNNIVNILSTSLCTTIFIEYLGNDLGPSVSTIVLTIAVLIFCEVTPKSIAKEQPEKFSMVFAPILNIVIIFLTPINFIFSQIKKLVSIFIKSKGDITVTEGELISFVEETAQSGTIDEEESNMIKNVIKFTDLDVIDIMTPIVDVVTAMDTITKFELANLFTECGYSRIPVRNSNMDIIGIINYKDFISEVFIEGKSISSIIRPAKFVHGGKNIRELLDEFKNEQTHIAIVMHEYGGVYGIVTLEDILEELVGDIWDEEDDKIENIVKINDTVYEVNGMANLLELDSELSLQIEDIEFNTVNGWVINFLNKLPKTGESFIFNNHTFTILETGKNRIEKLRIEL